MFKIFKKTPSEFKFKEPENTAVFTTVDVLKGSKPILVVTHDTEDGGWQFLTGETNLKQEDARIVSLKEITDIDPTINDLFEMPIGVGAQRTAVGANWQIFKLQA